MAANYALGGMWTPQQWSQYGNAVVFQAQADFNGQVGDLAETIEFPSGIYTRAYFYYAGACLRLQS